MDHDHLGFSDDDLDDLPANTLQHLEANAIRATQQRQQTHPPSESDYGLDDDGDEVINLDQGSEVLHLDHVAAQAQQYAHARHDYDYTTNNDNNNTHDALYGDDMDLEELAGPNQQLLRINKVRDAVVMCCVLLIVAARAREGPREETSPRPARKAADQGGRG